MHASPISLIQRDHEVPRAKFISVVSVHMKQLLYKAKEAASLICWGQDKSWARSLPSWDLQNSWGAATGVTGWAWLDWRHSWESCGLPAGKGRWSSSQVLLAWGLGSGLYPPMSSGGNLAPGESQRWALGRLLVGWRGEAAEPAGKDAGGFDSTRWGAAERGQKWFFSPLISGIKQFQKTAFSFFLDY